MKMQSINLNETSFKSRRNEHHSSTAAALVGATVGGALGYAVKAPISASKVYKMDSDSFSSIAGKNRLHPFQKMQANQVATVLKAKEDVKLISEEFANKLFDGKDKISTEEYLKKSTSGHISSTEQLEKIIQNDKKGLLKLKEEYARKQARLAEVTNQNDVNKINIMNESIAKTEQKFFKLKAKVTKYSEYKAVAKKAVKGEISKDALLKFSERATKRNLLPVVRENIFSLRSILPKAHSLGKALKFAGIGAIATVIINKITK